MQKKIILSRHSYQEQIIFLVRSNKCLIFNH